MSAPRPQVGDQVLVFTRDNPTDKAITAWTELILIDETQEIGVVDDPTIHREPLGIYLTDLGWLSPRKWWVEL